MSAVRARFTICNYLSKELQRGHLQGALVISELTNEHRALLISSSRTNLVQTPLRTHIKQFVDRGARRLAATMCLYRRSTRRYRRRETERVRLRDSRRMLYEIHLLYCITFVACLSPFGSCSHLLIPARTRAAEQLLEKSVKHVVQHLEHRTWNALTLKLL